MICIHRQVKCWGYDNNHGTNGREIVGSYLTTPPDTAIDLGDFYVSSVGAGSYHVCAVNEEGYVKCWGYNNSGTFFEFAVFNNA